MNEPQPESTLIPDLRLLLSRPPRETGEGGLLTRFQLFSTPARALGAETLKLESTLSNLVNQAARIVQW